MKPIIETTIAVVPKMYGYTTPEIKRHDGWTKIGYTERDDVNQRIHEQTHTADIKWNLEWSGNAVYENSNKTFRDTDFHAYLHKLGIEQEPNTKNEWFHVSGPQSKKHFWDFRENEGKTDTGVEAVPYALRAEQADAVQKTVAYREAHKNGEFLWNAKPRFGKTLTTYDFIKTIGARRVLVVTNRPAVSNSWFDDYRTFFGQESGYYFVSRDKGLENKRGVLTREQFDSAATDPSKKEKCIEFVSLQDLKGSLHLGGSLPKLKHLTEITWDVLVVDEAHEAVDTEQTELAFRNIKRGFTLHLSGTPFRALADNKFADDAVYSWTYADEQKSKRDWSKENGQNPYEELPRLNLFTYQMSEIIRDEVQQGIDIDGETEEYAFDLNEFFATTDDGKSFKHEASVNKFLDALTKLPKYPFSTKELRKELRHTFWLLDRIDSAKLLAKRLQAHPVFQEYEIVLAAGDGKLNDTDISEGSYKKVMNAIATHDKTITLSVGQLTTGVTVKPWTAVLMLKNIQSAAQYMQAAYRAQNPWLYSDGKVFRRKTNAYVFDFDPIRALTIFEKCANDLYKETSGGGGDEDKRKKNVRELLNFFPVIGEDDNGQMVELDPERILSIPRKLRSEEVVRRKFMSNFLFNNISNIFGVPSTVVGILRKMEPTGEATPVPEPEVIEKAGENVTFDKQGEPQIDPDYLKAQTEGLFGEKIYADDQKTVDFINELIEKSQDEDKAFAELKAFVKEDAIVKPMEVVQKAYGKDLSAKTKSSVQKKIKKEVDKEYNLLEQQYEIRKNELELEMQDKLRKQDLTGKEKAEIHKEYTEKIVSLVPEMKKDASELALKMKEKGCAEWVAAAEQAKKKRETDEIKDTIRDHLRGFTRTIPSFLMAYGREGVTLANFDTIVPEDVFLEVTSITLEEFRFLRDGGDDEDEQTGEIKHFDGQLFDEVVFNDAVKGFLKKKKDLANYFDETQTQDIFDYIPPQKTNQIYTPRAVVQKMVALLEEEYPGCFDDPDHTFIDLYMKSGLYITEIVKRLYQSKKMKKLYPDDKERLEHIFEKQVYGLAPTEIIYRIAIAYIMGFDEEAHGKNGEGGIRYNFKQLDATPHAKAGTLAAKLDEVFGK